MEHFTNRPLVIAISAGVSVVMALGVIGCENDPCKDSVLITAEEGTAEYEEQCEGLKDFQEGLEDIEKSQDSQ